MEPTDIPVVSIEVDLNRATFETQLKNLTPGTPYIATVRAKGSTGKYSDPYKFVFHTKLAEPRIQVAEFTHETIKGFVSMEGRFKSLHVTILPEPTRFLPCVISLIGPNFNFEFRWLVSGVKYEITVTATSFDGDEKKTDSVEVVLPCSPVSTKRQLILDDGWVLMALRADGSGDRFAYHVDSNVGYHTGEMMARNEIVMKFPRELFGKLLNASVTGFESCDWTLNPIAIGGIERVELKSKITSIDIIFVSYGLLDDIVIVITPDPLHVDGSSGQRTCTDLTGICELVDLDRKVEYDLKFYPHFQGIRGVPLEMKFRFASLEFLSPSISSSDIVNNRQTVTALFDVVSSDLKSLTVGVSPETEGRFILILLCWSFCRGS